MPETTTEWGVRAFHPCSEHGAKCPHSSTSLHGYPSRELALRMMAPSYGGSFPEQDAVLMRREVTEWTEA